MRRTDLEELLHLMQDQPAGRMVRTSKARAMFAMRACRKSVMVGKALTVAQMNTVSRTFRPYIGVSCHTDAWIGGASYGHHGPAVELSAWPADDEASCKPS